MKNRERFKDELIDVIMYETDEKLEKFYNKYIEPFYKSGKYGLLTSKKLNILINLWLDEEYKEPDVNWDTIPVDTPVLVKNYEEHDWHRRHFAKVVNGMVVTFKDGQSSWTSDGCLINWAYAKLPEDTEI